jgi:hypothetical protein
MIYITNDDKIQTKQIFMKGNKVTYRDQTNLIEEKK